MEFTYAYFTLKWRTKKKGNGDRLGDSLQTGERGQKSDKIKDILWARMRWGNKSDFILGSWSPDLIA